MGDKLRILLVDDDPDVSGVLAPFLEPDFEVLTATNGLDALEKLPRYEPDVFIIDLMMPGMDGWGLAQYIRQTPRFERAPMVFLTALDSVESIRRGYATGANVYITKPFDPERVRRNVQVFEERDHLVAKPKQYSLHVLRSQDRGKTPANPPTGTGVRNGGYRPAQGAGTGAGFGAAPAASTACATPAAYATPATPAASAAPRSVPADSAGSEVKAAGEPSVRVEPRPSRTGSTGMERLREGLSRRAAPRAEAVPECDTSSESLSSPPPQSSSPKFSPSPSPSPASVSAPSRPASPLASATPIPATSGSSSPRSPLPVLGLVPPRPSVHDDTTAPQKPLSPHRLPSVRATPQPSSPLRQPTPRTDLPDADPFETGPPAVLAEFPAKPRVLLVDDDEKVAELLRMALSRSFEVVSARDGMEAILAIPELQPDLFVIDIMLPRMNGLQLLKVIRQSADSREAPVIVLSGWTTTRDHDLALASGADAFVEKPCLPSTLLAELERLIQRPGFTVRHPKKKAL